MPSAFAPRLFAFALLLGSSLALAQPTEAPEPGPGPPPAPEEGEASSQQPTSDRPADAPHADAPPKGSNTPPKGSVVITFQGEPPKMGETVTPQADIATKEYVTFKGKAVCTGCDGDLILLVERKEVDPKGKLSSIVTSKRLEGPGAYELLVPQDDEPIILFLLVDANRSGAPDRGERAAMLELGGKLIPASDRSNLDLDATGK